MRNLRHRHLGLAFLAAGAVCLVVALVGAQTSGAELEYNATLHPDHVGATNPGFQSERCPAEGWGWHFVTQGSDTSFVAIKATFEEAGAITTFTSSPTPKHAYVYTPGPDTLLAAVALVDGPDLTFNLSHVCAGPTTTTTTTTEATTSTTEATTSTTEATTSTTEATTSTTEATTSTTEATTSTTEGTTSTTEATTSTTEGTTSTTEPGAVLDTSVDQPEAGEATVVLDEELTRTGFDSMPWTVAGVLFLALGAALLLRSRQLA